jgi:hypothetical protein
VRRTKRAPDIWREMATFYIASGAAPLACAKRGSNQTCMRRGVVQLWRRVAMSQTRLICFTHISQEHVPNISCVFNFILQQVFSCCKLLVFYLDIAYVVMTIHVCCKCVFQIFQLF